jgi:DNA-3-methyladenine glycosylase II
MGLAVVCDSLKMKTKFLLRSISPFRLDLTTWALQRRPGNLVDRYEGGVYRRVLALERGAFEIEVREVGDTGQSLEVSVAGEALSQEEKQKVKALVEAALGIQTDLSGFYRMAEPDSRLESLARRFRGLKPPRFYSIFEGLINGIACQQLSLSLGIQLLSRLSQRFGLSVGEGGSLRFAFPRPQDLADVNHEDIKRLGYSLQKARAITEIGRLVVEGQLDLDGLARQSDEDALRRLMALRGVGSWTAEYTLLRGMGRWHIFPVGDQGARNGLARWLHLRKPLDAAGAARILRRWQPYGGLIYFHMLMNGLDEAGYLKPPRSEPA